MADEKFVEECIHLLMPETCTICNGSDRKRRLSMLTVAYAFDAQYEGDCPTCGGGVSVGDELFRMGDDRIRCLTCVNSAAR